MTAGSACPTLGSTLKGGLEKLKGSWANSKPALRKIMLAYRTKCLRHDDGRIVFLYFKSDMPTNRFEM
jgi:hypothetical protein